MRHSFRKILIVVMAVIMLMAASFAMTGCGSNGEKTADENVIKTEKSAEKDADKPAADDQNTGDRDKTASEDKSDNDRNSENSNKDTSKSTTASTAATQTAVCYVSVEGYCSGKAITLQSGDTAYSVLKRTGATVSAEGTEFGIYVNGINGRFASGDSGWKYSVNGSEPNTSSNNYSVKSGDTVKWYWGSAY